jgi:hypothetical protein
MSSPKEIEKTMRQHLDSLMRDEDVADATEEIRKQKNSPKIRGDLERLEQLRREYPRVSPEVFRKMALARCSFMYEHFPDILFKLLKQEVDVKIVLRFADILGMVESGELNQHEASFQVGTILKKIHIDSVLRRDELRKQEEEEKKRRKKRKGPKKFSYAQWAERHPENE